MSRLLFLIFLYSGVTSCASYEPTSPCLAEELDPAIEIAKGYISDRRSYIEHNFLESYDFGKTCSFVFEPIGADDFDGLIMSSPIEVILFKKDWRYKTEKRHIQTFR